MSYSRDSKKSELKARRKRAINRQISSTPFIFCGKTGQDHSSCPEGIVNPKTVGMGICTGSKTCGYTR